MINYTPLLDILEYRDITLKQLIEELHMSSKTLAKLRKNEFTSMQILLKIALYLNVHLEDLYKIDYTVSYEGINTAKKANTNWHKNDPIVYMYKNNIKTKQEG